MLRFGPHLVFLLIVGGSAGRMLQVNGPLCPYVVTLSGLLAGCYVAGLALEHRLGRWRAPWLGVLLGWWLLLLWVVPGGLASAYAWCAVPLACVASAMLGRRAAAAAGVVISVAVAARGGSPELVVAPIAAVWATLALYRVQQRDAAARQRLVDELRATRAELARQQREAGTAAERARIARELHDTLAQELAGSRMLLQAADRDWRSRPDQARARVRAVTDALGDNLAETRRIIGDLTPPALDRQDLAAALRDLCDRAEQAGTAEHVTFRTVGDPSTTDDAAAVLLRVAQGALANVRDHARAGDVVVVLGGSADAVTLEVRDDGIGFTPGRAPAAPGRGFGLTASRDRLREYGGTLHLASAPGRGTVLTATLPTRRPTLAAAAA